jgi:hypothetical protein
MVPVTTNRCIFIASSKQLQTGQKTDPGKTVPKHLATTPENLGPKWKMGLAPGGVLQGVLQGESVEHSYNSYYTIVIIIWYNYMVIIIPAYYYSIVIP